MGQSYKAILLTTEGVPSMVVSPSIGSKLMEHSWLGNHYVDAVQSLLLGRAQRIVWAGTYGDSELGTDYNLYSVVSEMKIPNMKTMDNEYGPLPEVRYLVNHDLREFVDKNKIPTNYNGLVIHPLPLLTCEGNGRGNGDYEKPRYIKCNVSVIGRWARHTIEATNDITAIPADYEELLFDLVEQRPIA
jgi:hypothetical protein